MYVRFTEYYGDGTIYGRCDLQHPDGSPVKGAGKTKADLVAAGVITAEYKGAVGGDLVVLTDAAAAPADDGVAAAAAMPDAAGAEGGDGQ